MHFNKHSGESDPGDLKTTPGGLPAGEEGISPRRSLSLSPETVSLWCSALPLFLLPFPFSGGRRQPVTDYLSLHEICMGLGLRAYVREMKETINHSIKIEG